MRQRVTAPRLHEFMKALGQESSSLVRVFLVGGATAVLLGWRDSTVDIDLKLDPDSDSILKSFPDLKERLEINIELASPDDFIPELPGWQDRSQFIRQEGKIVFLHYDFYAQALAKIERGHDIDQKDVREMIRSHLIEPKRLLEMFSRIESQLYKYPALNPASFRRKVERLVEEANQDA